MLHVNLVQRERQIRRGVLLGIDEASTDIVLAYVLYECAAERLDIDRVVREQINNIIARDGARAHRLKVAFDQIAFGHWPLYGVVV